MPISKFIYNLFPSTQSNLVVCLRFVNFIFYIFSKT